MNVIKIHMKFAFSNTQLKKNLIVSKTNDVGDEDMMYEPLFDDINVETR